MASYTAEQLQQSFGIPAASAQALLSRLNTISSSASEGEGSGGVANSFSPVSPGISGLGFSGLNLGGFDADASIGPTTSTSGFSGFGDSFGESTANEEGFGNTVGDTVGSAISGIGDTVGSALSSSFSTPFGDVSVGDVALSLGLGAFTGVPGLGMVANAIGSAFGPSTGTAFGIGEQTGSGVSQGQQSAYGSTTGGPTDLGINAYGQAVDPNAEAVTGIDADAQAAAEAQAEAAALATADAIGFGLADDYADDIGDDGGASGSAPGAEMGGSEFRDGGIVQLQAPQQNNQSNTGIDSMFREGIPDFMRRVLRPNAF